jgi:uncharacterized membrane protein
MANVWDTIKPFVGKFAPMLGAAVGGPFGAAAGAIIGNALGIKDAKPEDIKAAIASGTLTGEQIVALKLAEQEFAKQMAELDINSVRDLEELAVKDRDSARNMKIQTGDMTPNYLAYFALAVWTTMNGFLLYMAFHGRSLPTDMSPIIMRVLGTMDALLGVAFAFFFGTTANSGRKDEMIHNSTPIK